VWKTIIAVVAALGLIVSAYFLGRTDAKPAELAELNRKIDSIGSTITDQQRNFAQQLGAITDRFGEFAGQLSDLGIGQGKIASGFGQMASRLSEIDGNIRSAIDRLDEADGIVGDNDEALRELLNNLQRLQAIIGTENTRH